MKRSIFFLVLLMSASSLWSKSWSLKIGGPHEDCIRSLCATNKNSIYFAGIERRKSSRQGKAFVGLASSQGKLLWLKKADFSDIVTFPTILSHQGAGLLFVARKSGLWLAKISAKGAIEWQRQYGVNGDFREPKACLLPDGIFVLLQLKKAEESLALLKLSLKGDLLWTKHIDAAGQQHSQDISSHPDGGAVIVSSCLPGPSFFSRVVTTISRKLRLHRLRRLVQSRPIEEAFVMHIDGKGQILWQKRLIAKEDCNLNAVSVSADGSILVSGLTITSKRNFKGTPFVILLTANYKVKWQYFIQGNDSAAAKSNTALEKGFAVGGFTRTRKRDMDMWYCRLEKSGQLKEFMRLGTKGGESQAYVAKGPKNTILVGGGIHAGESKNIDGFLCQLDEGAEISGLSEKVGATCQGESCELSPILVDFFPLGVTKVKTTVQLEDFDSSSD